MFGNRCSLCNGKLNSRKICKECGLDNSKSEKYYKINQSSCDNLPMTHVHEELRQKEKTVRKKPVKHADSTNKKGVMGGISVAIVMISVIISLITNLMDSGFIEPEPDYGIETVYDPYEYLEAELPEFGETCTYTLYSGQYVVGVHIPAGYYEATMVNISDAIEVTDQMNGIYLYQNMYDGANEYLDDLRLFDGAVVTITSQEGIQLDTENGQAEEMSVLTENHLTESYTMYGYDEAEAGIDFEAGIYDISTDSSYSYVNLTIYDEDGSEWDFRSFDLGEEGAHGASFKNVVIPEGAIISCEDAGVKMVPSEYIWTTDYMEHYY